MTVDPLRDFAPVTQVVGCISSWWRPYAARAQRRRADRVGEIAPGRSTTLLGAGVRRTSRGAASRAWRRWTSFHVPTGQRAELPGLLGGGIVHLRQPGAGAALYTRRAAGRARGAGRGALAAPSGVPTVGETLPGYELTNWFGLVAPPRRRRGRREIHGDVVSPARPGDHRELSGMGATAIGNDRRIRRNHARRFRKMGQAHSRSDIRRNEMESMISRRLRDRRSHPGFSGEDGVPRRAGWTRGAGPRRGPRRAVDVGSFTHAQGILEQLAKRGLEPQDVTDVILTHSHYDHSLNWILFRHGASSSRARAQLVAEQSPGKRPGARAVHAQLENWPTLHPVADGQEFMPGSARTPRRTHSGHLVSFPGQGQRRDLHRRGRRTAPSCYRARARDLRRSPEPRRSKKLAAVEKTPGQRPRSGPRSADDSKRTARSPTSAAPRALRCGSARTSR